MPHINKVSIKEKYRAWDSDILSKLKINKIVASDNKKKGVPKTDKSQQNQCKSNSKVVANQEQSGSITNSKVVAKDNQTNSKPIANWEQTSLKSDSTTKSKVVANQEQSGSKNKFFSLTGLQLRIVIFIYEFCKFARDKKTDPISIYQISDKCKHTVKTVKNAINRLVKKEILFRSCFKNGRGGWTVYSIPNDIYQEILNLESNSKAIANWEQTGSKVAFKLAPELIAPTSSSSVNILNTTTTGEIETPKTSVLNDEWLKIDLEPLSNIGFTQTHLTQIASQNMLPAELVQGSIYAFDFDLRENNKAKSITGDPINFFMGILRKGKPYAPTSNYESPQDKAMRIYRERMSEIEQKRVDAEKEAINLAFNDWFSKLTNEQKIGFLPEMLRRTAIQRNENGEKIDKSKILESSARKHFEVKIWPEKKAEIIQQTVKEDETRS
jgi:hypothetical protein